MALVELWNTAKGLESDSSAQTFTMHRELLNAYTNVNGGTEHATASELPA